MCYITYYMLMDYESGKLSLYNYNNIVKHLHLIEELRDLDDM